MARPKKTIAEDGDKRKAAITLPSLANCNNCKFLQRNEDFNHLGYCLKIKMPIPLDRDHHCIFKKKL